MLFLYDTKTIKTTFQAHRSLCRYKGSMVNLVQYGRHLMFISKLSALLKTFRCHHCEQIFNNHQHYRRHIEQPQCPSGQKIIHPGGAFMPPKDIFEQLQLLKYNVTDDQRFFRYRAVFDFESMNVSMGSSVVFEPLLPLTEPQLPPDFQQRRELLTKEYLEARRQHFSRDVRAAISLNAKVLRTVYRSNGRQTVQLPPGVIQPNAEASVCLETVKPFIHQLFARQTMAYLIKRIKLHWIENDDANSAVLSRDIQHYPVKVMKPADVDLVFNGGVLALHSVPSDAHLISFECSFDYVKQELKRWYQSVGLLEQIFRQWIGSITT